MALESYKTVYFGLRFHKARNTLPDDERHIQGDTGQRTKVYKSSYKSKVYIIHSFTLYVVFVRLPFFVVFFTYSALKHID